MELDKKELNISQKWLAECLGNLLLHEDCWNCPSSKLKGKWGGGVSRSMMSAMRALWNRVAEKSWQQSSTGSAQGASQTTCSSSTALNMMEPVGWTSPYGERRQAVHRRTEGFQQKWEGLWRLQEVMGLGQQTFCHISRNLCLKMISACINRQLVPRSFTSSNWLAPCWPR